MKKQIRIYFVLFYRLKLNKMGNCQDQFQNINQYQTSLDKQQALIDRSHKKIFSTKYQKNIGYLINKQERQNFDNQILHKSLVLNKSKLIDKPIQRRTKFVAQLPQLQPLDLKFYHTLCLPQYTYSNKSQDMKMSKKIDQKQIFIHQSQDKVGVVYVGQRNNQGKFHGNGVLKANTVHYIGQFFQGTKHFHGRQIYSNQVYQGQFLYDYRRGKGTRYTPEYIDQGTFDKVILYGQRTFLNGNKYRGQFQNNLMHTTKNTSFDGRSYFYDAKNHLRYEDQLEFKDGNLIRAKQVYRQSSWDATQKQRHLIGCYINQKIVKIDDPSYHIIIRNWDNNPENKINQNNTLKSYKQAQYETQEQKIRKRIQEWQ